MSQNPTPDFSVDFPAQRLTTHLEFEDLVVPEVTRQELWHILSWLQHSKILLADWGLGTRISPGYRALFVGPSGTGKTLTATLLGRSAGRDVYRVDLAMVVSKYIGETEKNLSRVFDMASERGWILFFDEADALFGNRPGATGSNDRYANQEVSYLLQRIEDFDGLVILATNLQSAIDPAFVRRFQSLLQFHDPDAQAREQIWRQMLSPGWVADDVDIPKLAEDYALNGSDIANVLRRAAVSAQTQDQPCLTMALLKDAIRHELRKNGS